MELDAIVVLDRLSAVRIAGLSAGERARRVVLRAGASRVLVVEQPGPEIAAWRGTRTCAVLVVAADQLVHTPLVAPLVAAPPVDGVAIAVGPDDAYAGALLATGSGASAVVEALARGEALHGLAAMATHRVPHGALARHAIATAADRRAAHRLLYRILIKPQDNAITRYLYRPVSFPLTRLLVWTPITPNQVSYAVAAMVLVGCWLTASAEVGRVIAGTAVILVASYVDCCDGEIARVKLLSSRWGAWLDTVVDELSSLGYLAALGWHCHLAYGASWFGAAGTLGLDPWLALTAVGGLAIAVSMYCIYYNLIVVVGSANSQDYATKVEVVPGSRPSAVRLRPAVVTVQRTRPAWMTALWTLLTYMIRRDFISWAALAVALLGATHVLFALFWIGSVLTFGVVAIDHVKLRRLRREIARSGRVVERAT